MKLTLVALLAAAAAALATPAAAINCLDTAVADDSYYPGETPLPIPVQEAVRARRDGGLSLAGFYNDPAQALAPRYAPAAYGDYGYERHNGPHVIVGSYGHRYRRARAY